MMDQSIRHFPAACNRLCSSLMAAKACDCKKEEKRDQAVTFGFYSELRFLVKLLPKFLLRALGCKDYLLTLV